MIDKTNPNRYLEPKEPKSKPRKLPRGAVTKKKSGMYKALLTVRGVDINLGYYKERSHAVKAYWDAVNECGDD